MSKHISVERLLGLPAESEEEVVAATGQLDLWRIAIEVVQAPLQDDESLIRLHSIQVDILASKSSLSSETLQ